MQRTGNIWLLEFLAGCAICDLLQTGGRVTSRRQAGADTARHRPARNRSRLGRLDSELVRVGDGVVYAGCRACRGTPDGRGGLSFRSRVEFDAIAATFSDTGITIYWQNIFPIIPSPRPSRVLSGLPYLLNVCPRLGDFPHDCLRLRSGGDDFSLGVPGMGRVTHSRAAFDLVGP